MIHRHIVFTWILFLRVLCQTTLRENSVHAFVVIVPQQQQQHQHSFCDWRSQYHRRHHRHRHHGQVEWPLAAAAAAKSSKGSNQNHEKWQPYFDALVAFRDAHGHVQVPKDDPEYQDLYHWLQDQQQSWHHLQQGRKTKLTRKRAIALERIGALAVVGAMEKDESSSQTHRSDGERTEETNEFLEQ